MIGAIGEGLYELGVDEGAVYAQPRRGYGGDAANTAVMAARLGGARLLRPRRRRRARRAAARVLAPGRCRHTPRDDRRRADRDLRQRAPQRRRQPVPLPPAQLGGQPALRWTTSPMSSSTGSTRCTTPASHSQSRRRRQRRPGSLLRVRASAAPSSRSRSTTGPALQPDERELAAAANAADVVFVSSEESELVLGAGAPSTTSREFVLTLGADGAVAFTGGEEIRSHAGAGGERRRDRCRGRARSRVPRGAGRRASRSSGAHTSRRGRDALVPGVRRCSLLSRRGGARAAVTS